MAKTLVLTLTSGELDELTPSLVRLLTLGDTALAVFRLLLQEESEACKEGFSVDSYTAVSKMCTAFARR